MNIIKTLDQLPEKRPVVLAFGFFDGVHRGHQAVLQACLRLAREKKAMPAAVTFYPHPLTVLLPSASIQLLLSESEKEELFKQMGFETTVVISPTEEFLGQSAGRFLQSLSRITSLCGIVTGENFTFGKNAEGNAELLNSYFLDKGVFIQIVKLEKAEGGVISSTRIRKCILQGDVKKAGYFLGRPYRICGDIIHGFRRGTEVLGFPTANLKLDKERAVPGDGVYATRAFIRGRQYPSVTNVGTNPTFGNKERSIETFIFSFDEKIYDAPFALEWIEKIREEKKFPDIEALRRQIEEDIKRAKQILEV
jgi:riboflavin kinase/FMN adenylyltransferase